MRRLAAAIAICLVLVVAVLAVAWWLGGRGPLEGDMEHDFGVVPVDGPGAAVTHDFVLTNASDAPVRLLATRPSCGCTVASPSVKVVEPGGQVAIEATLSFTGSGRGSSRIKVIMEHEGAERVQTLSVEGVGRRLDPLSASRDWVALGPDMPARVTIRFEVPDHNERPPEPRLITPPGVRATFPGWKQGQKHRSRNQQPARWGAFVDIEQEAGTELPEDAQLLVRMAPDHELVIGLRGDLAQYDPRRGLPTPDELRSSRLSPPGEPESPEGSAPDDREASPPASEPPPPGAAPDD